MFLPASTPFLLPILMISMLCQNRNGCCPCVPRAQQQLIVTSSNERHSFFARRNCFDHEFVYYIEVFAQVGVVLYGYLSTNLLNTTIDKSKLSRIKPREYQGLEEEEENTSRRFSMSLILFSRPLTLFASWGSCCGCVDPTFPSKNERGSKFALFCGFAMSGKLIKSIIMGGAFSFTSWFSSR